LFYSKIPDSETSLPEADKLRVNIIFTQYSKLNTPAFTTATARQAMLLSKAGKHTAP